MKVLKAQNMDYKAISQTLNAFKHPKTDGKNEGVYINVLNSPKYGL